MNKPRDIDAGLLEELKSLLGDRATASTGVREHHGKDESYFPYAPPDAVVFPESTEEVRAVVDLCRRHRTPVIPFGVGTSLEGHVLAIRGGVCVDLSRMNQVLAVHELRRRRIRLRHRARRRRRERATRCDPDLRVEYRRRTGRRAHLSQ